MEALKRRTERRRTSQKLLILVSLALALGAGSVLASNPPAAPLHFTRGASSTFNASNLALVSTDAMAGNITYLSISGLSQTRAWQGYYGNVSGYITLDDANNYTFYNWSATEPRGYIYASLVSHGQVSWVDVTCFSHAANASLFQNYYNINQDDYDNVTNTYNVTLADSGTTVQLVNNSFNDCPATYIWRDDNYQTGDFINYLMWDSTGGNDGWVFGTIIENKDTSNKTDISCYNGELCDFQLLVAEDGHAAAQANTVTPYYIWVDLQG